MEILSYGLAVLEALYYKTPIACKKQLPLGYEKSPNCYIYEGKEIRKMYYSLLENIKFEENDEIVKRDCSVEEYNKRLES